MYSFAFLTKTLLPLVLLNFSVGVQVYAQGEKDTSTVYLNELLEPTTKRKAIFNASGIKEADAYILIAYDLDKRLMYKGTYSDKHFKIKNGKVTYYYPEGTEESSGNYHNNKKDGIWKSWYTNGSLKDSGEYKDNLMVGSWTCWHSNGALKSNTALVHIEKFTQTADGKKEKNVIEVADGLFNSWYDNGMQESEGKYQYGKQIGLWKYYYTNVNLSTEEWLSFTGRVDSMHCYDSNGRYQTNFCSLNKPALLIKFGEFRPHLTTELKVPAGGITQWPNGDVTIRFTVNKEGKMEDLKVISNNRNFAETIHQFMKKLPNWEPAISHNRIVAWKEEVTLDYGYNQTLNNRKRNITVQSPDLPLNAYEVEDEWN